MKEKQWQELFKMLTEDKVKYSDVSIRQLCERLGIHHTTFYYHFEDKEMLLKNGVELLLKDYFKIDRDERFTKPFSSSDIFYQGSDLLTLIEGQRYDDACSNLITKWSKDLMTRDAEVFIKENDFDSREGLTARQLVETIFTISEWNETVNKTVEELDQHYKELVKNL